jgi:hypothetical protein
VPNFNNVQGLKDSRKADYKNDVERKMAEFEKHSKVVKTTQSKIPD